MPDVYGTYSYPDGLTPGKSEDGGLSALLFNQEGNLADHASFFPDAERSIGAMSKPDGRGTDAAPLIGAAVVGAAAMGAVAAGVYLVPRVAPWGREKLAAVSQRVRKVLGAAGDLRADDSALRSEESLAPLPAPSAIALGSKTTPLP